MPIARKIKLAAFSLLEVIVGLLLTLSVGFMLITSIHVGGISYFGAKRKYQFLYAKHRIQSEILRTFESLDSHRYALPTRIHKNGLIEFADRTTHILTLRSDSLRPKAGSDAITFIGIDPTRSFEVLSWNGLGNPNEICAYQHSTSPKHQEYLALGFDTQSAYQLTRFTPTSPFCFKLDALKSPNIALPKITENPSDPARILLPVIRTFTLYLDQKANLRIATHQGESIKSNQPVLAGIDSINFSMEEKAIGIKAIQTELKAHGHRQQFTTFNQISRLPLEKILY